MPPSPSVIGSRPRRDVGLAPEGPSLGQDSFNRSPSNSMYPGEFTTPPFDNETQARHPERHIAWNRLEKGGSRGGLGAIRPPSVRTWRRSGSALKCPIERSLRPERGESRDDYYRQLGRAQKALCVLNPAAKKIGPNRYVLFAAKTSQCRKPAHTEPSRKFSNVWRRLP